MFSRSLRATACALVLVPAAARAGDPPSRALLLELTQEPRLAGTKGSYTAARFVADRLTAAGWQARIEDFEVLLSYPRRIELAIHPSAGAAAISERLESFDPDAIPCGDVPLYNAWSASGDVRAPVVDVGRGLRADFERLKANGVDVRGAIALCRYGGSYRGIKVDLAAQYGCVAVLLYSDSAGDGALKGDTWPKGPWKPGHEAQRGSISSMGRCPGDPSTPGWPSPKPGASARRLAGAELDALLPKIPCVPIGSTEAERIRALLATRAIKADTGASVEQSIGPGPVEVHLLVDCPRMLRTIHDVIGTLPGASEDCVIAGCHRDAWVRGANDDGSGVVALLRAAQRLAERVKSGWKPPNSIQLAFWDAEEFGMIGSTEWGETHADWIRAHCIAYVNSDTACQGTHFRGASGTPGLLGVLKSALERVPTPLPRNDDEPTNLWEDWRASLKPNELPKIGLAGSGSDFAVFLHHLARPVVDVSLSGNSGGQYHTNFDDFAMVERYLDPGFVGHEMVGQLIEELLVEFAQRGRASFDPSEAASSLAGIARDAAKTEEGNLATSLMQLWVRFRELARSLKDVEGARIDFYDTLAAPEGVPGRPWYRNRLWTPGLEDGYGSESFPTLRSAAKEGSEAIARESERLRRCLDSLVKQAERGR